MFSAYDADWVLERGGYLENILKEVIPEDKWGKYALLITQKILSEAFYVMYN